LKAYFYPLLFVTGDAAFVVGSAVTAVATGRVKLSFNFVHGNEVAAMLEFPVWSVAITDGRLHFNLVGVAVIAE
jgi:hypothetical protein